MRLRTLAFVAAFSLSATQTAKADVRFTLYFGASQTAPSDLVVRQPARGNNLTVHNMRWIAYPFRAEPYYGWRITYRRHDDARGEFHIDFTHYKIYGPTEDTALQSGVWHGAPVSDDAPIRTRVQSFELTHGANMLGLTYYQRLGVGDGVYFGGGPVVYVPHSENRVDGTAGGDGYRYGGSGWMAVGGASACEENGRSVIAEVKIDRGAVRVPIAEGEALLRLRTTHELVGATFGHCLTRQRLQSDSTSFPRNAAGAQRFIGPGHKCSDLPKCF